MALPLAALELSESIFPQTEREVTAEELKLVLNQHLADAKLRSVSVGEENTLRNEDH